ncbi:hypothetical protein VCHENC02_3486, partial [Vibrio harveyi]
MFYFF